MLDSTKVRADFPLLKQEINGNPLVYFDNGATSQKPQLVIDAISRYYQETNANIHRGVHTLSQRATDAYEAAREIIREHLNAAHAYEVLFTAGTTHGINLVAHGFASFLQAGDEVLISAMEHHSNIVPWQLLCEKTGASLRVIPMNEQGELIQEAYQELLNSRTKLVAVTLISNALGTINPIQEMVARAHQVGAAFLVDGAQAVPHLQPDVQALDCDFYAFSGHKMCGPTGTGILYGKEEWLHKLPPYQGGGEMIKTVTFEKTTYADLPHKFEAGTPHIAGGIALGVAVQYMQNIGFDKIHAYEAELTRHLFQRLAEIPQVQTYGPLPQGDGGNRAALAAFTAGDVHPHDLSTILDQAGVAIRAGHHCTQPLHRYLKVQSTARASLYFYNTVEEIDIFIEALKEAVDFFAAIF